jgi:TolB-like protein/Tfp pilus assembly protein PilF
MNVRTEIWARVKAVLEGALELEGAARFAYVAGACADDAEVRGHVERLLASHERAATFLEQPAFATMDALTDDLTGQLVSNYRIEARLGAGGMGEVYKAHDLKLDRQVALKLLPIYLAADPDRLRRFHVEARAASSLNHPNILVIHDFGEQDGRPFMVTEYVEGQTLRERLARGPMPIRELLDVAAQIASALAAAHERGVLHRDIKPENVMVRPDGYVKVVDFGLAKVVTPEQPAAVALLQTRQGLTMGTPQYMSPEQARGERVDFRSDQFSFGALLYELATKRAPFERGSIIETAAAVIADEPDALDRTCPQAPPALRRIIERCLAKKAGDRYSSTRDLHRELVAVQERPPELAAALRPQVAVRHAIVVLPLKILRGRPDAEFLAFSLPDAIASSLADRPMIAVRSPLAVERHGGADADLAMLAEAMSARFALTGTLTCLDDRIALRLQLLAIPSGTVMWSDSRVATLHELFDLQDAVAGHVARALPASMAAAPAAVSAEPVRDTPKNAGAYAFYLRANQLAYEVSRWTEARDLYRASVESDPDYAPAWARLARCERLIGKFSASPAEAKACLARAEEAFQRALALNPDLSIAHSFYAQLLIDIGRGDQAMQRLLERVRCRPTDPELYAGLVHALRYCGLLDASVAAHRRAQALDPTMPTSIHHTWWMKGEYERALAETFGDIGYMQGLALASLGREKEAVAALRWRERETTETRIRPFLASLRALLDGDREKSLAALDTAAALQIDAEALYYLTRTFARLGVSDRAARELHRVVAGGFWCYDAFARDPWLDPIRDREDVRLLLERTHQHVERARSTFVNSGGPELMDLPLTNAVQ